jgi:DNA-binding transcriptional LysR family regulator
MRERWFGATGRRVPAIALDGSLDVGDALVLDGIDDLEALRSAHADGVPVVVRASDAAGVARALARPEVACVLVPDPALLDIDLPELTYG